MKGNVLQQFTGRPANDRENLEESATLTDDYGAFALLRGVRDFARFLQIRKKDGDSIAIGYAWLERVETSPDCITLCFTGQKVKIIGRNLDAEIRPNVRLIDAVLRHRCPWIQEADAVTATLADKQALVIERIELGN